MAHLIQLALVVVLAAIPETAHTAPIVVAIAASYIAETVVASMVLSALLTSFQAMIIQAAISFAISSIANAALSSGKSSQAESAPTIQVEARDRTVVVRSAVDTHRWVYGRVVVSGPLIYAESVTVTSANDWLYFVIPVAGHEVAAIEDIFFGDEGVGVSDVATGPQGQYYGDSVRYSSSTVFGKHLGAPGQTVDYQLNSLSSKWTADCTVDGIAYITVGMFWDQNVFPTGIPNIKAVVRGKKLYDPRLAGSPTAYAYSRNWALVVRDYLTAAGGLGCGEDEIDDDTFIAAANVSDERVSIRDIGSPAYQPTFTADAATDRLTFLEPELRTETGDRVAVYSAGTLPGGLSGSPNEFYVIRKTPTQVKLAYTYALAMAGTPIDLTDAGTGTHSMIPLDHARYTVDGTIDTATPPQKILENLLSAGAGTLVNSMGKWRLFAGAYTAPVAAIDADWLRGGLEGLPRPARRDLMNAVRGVYAESNKGWQPTDFPPVTNATYVAEDGGEQIFRDIELQHTTNSIRAQRIAKIILEKSRQGMTLRLPCNMKGFSLSVGERVTLTFDIMGFSSKVFLITGWTFVPPGGVDLLLQEDASASYDWNQGNATLKDPAPNTNLPDPFSGLTITDLTATSGTADLFRQADGTIVPRVRLRWTDPGNAYGNYYEVQFERLSVSPTEWADEPKRVAPAHETFIYGANDGEVINARIRLRTTIGNAGPWAYVYSHTVVGKTEKPSDVTGLTAIQAGPNVLISVADVEDSDLDLIEIRLFPQTGHTWVDDDPSNVITNILRGKTATTAACPPGEWALCAKAKDTSGNYSANETCVDITVAATGVQLLASQEAAPFHDGVTLLTNMVRHWTGVLVPASQSTAAALGWEVFDQCVPNPYVDCYAEAKEIDTGGNGTARIWGQISSELAPGETFGSGACMFEADYRLSAGSYDGFEPWTVGQAPLRYCKGRLHLDTSVAGVTVVTSLVTNVDADVHEESGTLTVDGTGSGAVLFSTTFRSTPVLQLTPQGPGDVTANYNSLSTAGFTGNFRTGGIAGAGTMSYTATGV